MQDYKDVLSEILIDAEALQARVKELGAQISADYATEDLLLICILRGGVPFMVDLEPQHHHAAHDGFYGRIFLWRR